MSQESPAATENQIIININSQPEFKTNTLKLLDEL